MTSLVERFSVRANSGRQGEISEIMSAARRSLSTSLELRQECLRVLRTGVGLHEFINESGGAFCYSDGIRAAADKLNEALEVLRIRGGAGSNDITRGDDHVSSRLRQVQLGVVALLDEELMIPGYYIRRYIRLPEPGDPEVEKLHELAVSVFNGVKGKGAFDGLDDLQKIAYLNLFVNRIIRYDKRARYLDYNGKELLELNILRRKGVCRHKAAILGLLLQLESIDSVFVIGFAKKINGNTVYVPYLLPVGESANYNGPRNHAWLKVWFGRHMLLVDPTMGNIAPYWKAARLTEELVEGRMLELETRQAALKTQARLPVA